MFKAIDPVGYGAFDEGDEFVPLFGGDFELNPPDDLGPMIGAAARLDHSSIILAGKRQFKSFIAKSTLRVGDFDDSIPHFAAADKTHGSNGSDPLTIHPAGINDRKPTVETVNRSDSQPNFFDGRIDNLRHIRGREHISPQGCWENVTTTSIASPPRLDFVRLLYSFGSAQFVEEKLAGAQPSRIGVTAKVEGSGVNNPACVGVFNLYLHAADQSADLVEIAEHDEIRAGAARQVDFATVARTQKLASKNRVELDAHNLAVGNRLNFAVGEFLRDGVTHETQATRMFGAMIDRLAGSVEDFEIEHEQALLGLRACHSRRNNRQSQDKRGEPNK